MHNSPLKCTTNSEAISPEKISPKLQSQAYKNSGSKASSHASPVKASPAKNQNSPSPQKGENFAMEGSSPPRKYQSPSRTSAMKKSSSPVKHSLPFGKPIEIIKSKSPFIRHTQTLL